MTFKRRMLHLAPRALIGCSVLAFTLLIAPPVNGQTLRAGGGAAAMTQTQSRTSLGGTASSLIFLFGRRVSPRAWVEIETTVSGEFDGKRSYGPKQGPAQGTASRRDIFFIAQVRWKLGQLEPVVGAGYVTGRAGIDARFVDTGRIYLDVQHRDHGYALTGGLDLAIPVNHHFALVPSFRAMVRSTADHPDTAPGARAIRYGVIARVDF